MNIDLSNLITERRNPASNNIDTLSTLEMLTVINNEDRRVPEAITPYLPQIAQLVDRVAQAFAEGGRLIYIGAGTSGRLGILDASECPPTFGTRPEQVVGIIAGGHKAILSAVENVEDNREQGAADLKALNFSAKDVLVGLAASGRTPYVLGAMAWAKSLNASIAVVSCNPQSEMAALADIAITPAVGPEVVTGSTRLKAGTAQKLVLNMITTGAMIRSGKVYSNLMVDVEATNAKLIERQISIVMDATDCDRDTAQAALQQCNRHCKTAIVMVLTGLDAAQAGAVLEQNNGFIRLALHNA
ncbi:N-acetylmuramic acid 6-phosphate etherase [Atlantibacter subterranea]|uniref:N-acetylmuramic acid 6-phosphate etherase n=2 Tax=Atlantibacter subterraneus TaxID=255519 RepID=A0A427UQE4_9ENTR|nr:N-acetylmuramic acid 6-phosphate etherase [Atlantibacter subterranea]MDA3131200.1 N-acetylmuramic acid 6-phosphate etherase [Atlantibacter subterranea]RSB59668.1 N-acetylmuramic acid 6-phosphate etherase [Atlantibacter subterranea]RSE05629.1 N-acetylmuramic acid 6-phosphate etherase [Atlantibacter subterranea]RSE22484.1 N-acetylmuramic acid 6-phosphate etherase [Atlantibacter subterranea]